MFEEAKKYAEKICGDRRSIVCLVVIGIYGEMSPRCEDCASVRTPTFKECSACYTPHVTKFGPWGVKYVEGPRERKGVGGMRALICHPQKKRVHAR